LSGDGKVVFSQCDETVCDSLWAFDSQSLKTEQILTAASVNLAGVNDGQALSNGHYAFRGTSNGHDQGFYDFAKQQLVAPLVEGVNTFNFKASYLFSPSVNASGQWAFKARLGEKGQWDESQPDLIVLLTPQAGGFAVQVVAQDNQANPTSPFTAFDNSVSLSNNGFLAYVASLSKTQKTLVVFKNGVAQEIVREGTQGISEIELFRPQVNDQGWVVFRAKDLQGQRGIYIADQNKHLQKLIGEGDAVPTENGPARIFADPSGPGFGGNVAMNNQGQILFYALLVSTDRSLDEGAGVFELSPQKGLEALTSAPLHAENKL